MTQTAAKTVSRTAVADFKSGYQNTKSAGNVAFTGLFRLYCYTYLCIKNLVLIDSAKDTGEFLSDSLE